MSREQQASEGGSVEAVLRAALGSMPYGFSIWDEDRRLVLWNQYYEQIYRFELAGCGAGIRRTDLSRS